MPSENELPIVVEGDKAKAVDSKSPSPGGGLDRECVDHMLRTLDFYAEGMKEIMAKASPQDLVIMAAYFQAAMDVQDVTTGHAFDDMRQFWWVYYPKILEGAGLPAQAQKGPGGTRKFHVLIPRQEQMTEKVQ